MERSRQSLFGKGTFLPLLAHAQRLLEDSSTPIFRANRRQRYARADGSNDTWLPRCTGAMKDSDQGLGPSGGSDAQ